MKIITRNMIVGALISFTYFNSQFVLAAENLTKVNFNEDAELAKKYRTHKKSYYNERSGYLKAFDLNKDGINDEEKVLFSKFDLNEDGVEELVVKFSSDHRICPMIGCPDLIEIYDNNFNNILTNREGYGEVLLSKNKSNHYRDILMSCLTLEEKARKFIFSKKLKKYALNFNSSKGACTLSDEQNRRLKNIN